MGLPVEDAMALLQDREAERLGEMALAGAERSSDILRHLTMSVWR